MSYFIHIQTLVLYSQSGDINVCRHISVSMLELPLRDTNQIIISFKFEVKL